MVLSEREVQRIRLFAAIVLGRWDEVERVRRSTEPDRAFREAVLQSHLFAGFPRTVEALEILDRAGGLGPPEPGEDDAPLADGAPLFGRIYAEQADAVRDRLFARHPALAAMILEHAYGRVLSRPGLTPVERELLAVAALAVTRQDRQLMSHVRGAVRCGASRETVRRAVEVVADLMTAAELASALAIVEKYAA